MSKLDDRLKEALEGTPNPMAIKIWMNEIKQAFADEGYIHIHASQETQAAIANTILGNKVMTGQEWYSRFEKELYKGITPIATDLMTRGVVLKIAKRAAGLE